MHDLKSKLELYKSSQVKKVDKPVNTGFDVHDILKGAICSNDYGSYFAIQKTYPLSYYYGGYSLDEIDRINMPTLRRVCDGLDKNSSIREFIFLDTETTGLSGGAGTVAFLIGAGFFSEDAFIIKQYFMRDYNEECAMLKDLDSIMSKYRGLVTFNGKSFDWNLLQSRFAFNRIRPTLKEPVHIDLLFPSRKIWKMKLENCRLSSIEENILGEHRVDDIPGSMIPAAYFKYLEDRNAADIKKIIMHNELDILSMTSLITKICTLLEKPLFETDGEQELLGVGKIFETSEEYDLVIDCYESCLKSDSSFIKESASKRLGDIYKKNKDYDKAAEYWRNMLSESETLSLYPAIELAKYYEHRKKDIDKAMDVVEKAMHQILQMGLKNSMYYEDIKKRYERLKRKAKT